MLITWDRDFYEGDEEGVETRVSRRGGGIVVPDCCKAARRGIDLVAVNPAYTSQRCSRCQCVDAASRRTQAAFTCTCCGFSLNADENAARNILAAGLAATACGGDVRPGISMHGCPSEARTHREGTHALA